MQVAAVTIHNFRSIKDASIILDDYCLIVGANNCGKTNVIDAIRVFYEKGIKYQHAQDFPKFPVDDGESWVELEFVLSEAEYDSIVEEYRQPDHRLRVRKYLYTAEKGNDGKVKSGIYGYVGNKLSCEHFYGARNVQQGKLGEIIYIPAVNRLDDHTKLSGPSELRELINTIVKQLADSSPPFQQLVEYFEAFSDSVSIETTADGRSLAGLVADINAEIGDWQISTKLKINPLSDADLVKNLVELDLFDMKLDSEVDASRFGQGFQRHLVFTLIRLAAQYQAPVRSPTRKDFSPSMTLLLFEEPEAFLHPMQQGTLYRSLRTLVEQEGKQALVSSHSTQFVSLNAMQMTSIVRLCRDDVCTEFGQISSAQLDVIFADNIVVNDLVEGTSWAADADDYLEDMESIKYCLWLDPHRCGMFFAGHVILVEGPTERALLNYLIDTGRINYPAGGLFVLDSFGKINIHRFMNLLGAVNVNHSVLFDADNEMPPHPKVRKLIEESRNDQTCRIDSFPNELEDFLGIEKTKKHRKPQHVMLRLLEGRIADDRLDALAKKVETLVGVGSV